MELIPFSKLKSIFLEPSSKNLVSRKMELGSRKLGNISNRNVGTQGNLNFFLHFLEILVGDINCVILEMKFRIKNTD